MDKKSILKYLLMVLFGLVILVYVRSLNLVDPFPLAILFFGVFGFIGSYIWIFSSEKNNLILVSSITFSVFLKLINAIRQPTGIVWNSWGYFWESYYSIVQNYSYLAESSLGVVKIYSQYPATSIVYNFISFLTGLNFEFLYKYLMPFIYSILVLTFLYLILINLGFNQKLANIGLILFNINFIFQRNYAFSYQLLGGIFFIILLFILTKKFKIFYKIVSIILMFCILFLTHHFSFLMGVLFFILFWYFDLIPEVKSNIKYKKYFLVGITLVFIFGILFVILNPSVQGNYNLYLNGFFEAVQSILVNSSSTLKSYSSSEFILTQIGSYLGQFILLVIGIVGYFYEFNYKKNSIFKKLWIGGWILNFLFLFVIPWQSSYLITFQDLRFRVVEFSFILFLPLSIIGFFHIQKNIFNNSKVLEYLILFILLFSVIISLPNENLFDKDVDLASENNVFPYHWEQAGTWGTQNLVFEKTIILGSYRSSYIWAKSGIPLASNTPLDILLINDTWVQEYNNLYIAFSNANLQYPEFIWSSKEFNVWVETLDLTSNKIYDNGDVFILQAN